MEYTHWIWRAHLPALLKLLAQAAQAPLRAQDEELLRYALHGTDSEAGQWADYPVPAGAALRARLALDPDDRDVLHVALFGPSSLCEKVQCLSLKKPFG
jgi:hypothetical protein